MYTPRPTARPTLRRFASGLIVASVLIAACSGDDEDTEETTPPTEAPTTATPEITTATTGAPAATTATTEAPVEEPLRRPLTGEVVESEDELLDRPALVVKIDNNNPNARPNHTGLAVADIVFEEIVEAQDTRFAAVFHSQDADPVGPIRSGRSQDVDILTAFNEPLFAWSGGNPGVTRLIAESALVDLNQTLTGEGYYRGPGSAPHDVYSTTEALFAQTPEGHPGPPPQQFQYVLPGQAFDGDPVSDVDLQMRSKDIRWEWSPDDAGFLRFQEGTPHVDVTYGDIVATNVVVLVAEYRPSPIDTRSPEAQTLGSGPVYVFSDGEVKIGRWNRAEAIAPFEFVDLDGNPIELTPGNTWVELAELTNEPEGDASFVISEEAYLAEQETQSEDDPPEPIRPENIDLDDPENAPTDIEFRLADTEGGDTDADPSSTEVASTDDT